MKNAIARAKAHSPFLTLAMERLPDLAEILVAGKVEEAIAFARQLGTDVDDTGIALRRERLGIALALGIADLAGAIPLSRVLSELSALADRSLDQAITAIIQDRVPDSQPAGFTAIALGKHGAQELNYSSDIDPILLFDPETLPRRERDEPGEAAQRYARALVEMLGAQTREGYVFRVDLRLRPASEVSPLAISFNAALSHYESSALAWERAAYIRSRSSAGDIAAGEQFLESIRPFVWRRSLDFTAIEEIRRLTGRIRQAYTGPLDPGPGFDIKRGRGGIREIEFYAQTHQLIYGGRIPELRLRGTRAALDALARHDIITADAAQVLGESYDRLRMIEHRLQMVDDRQTHSLPDSGDALENVALLDGLSGAKALLDELRGICGGVAAYYDDLLGEDEQTAVAVSGPETDPAYKSEFMAKVEHWRNNIRCLRGSESRKALDAIVPDLMKAMANAPEPERALIRWETLLRKLPSAVNLFRLFEQRPGLLEQVLRILTLAGPLADQLAMRPELLDALIDSTALDLPETVAELAERMANCEDDDYEALLSHIRLIVGEERFALGVQLIDGRHDPLLIAEGLCRVAEAALQTGVQAAAAEFARNHGQIEGDELIVLGLGRFGGGALTHASDLDIVYLFTGDVGQESDGRRPLSASLYFNRLATRVTAALSVPTAEGALYEVDTRLRPQGNQGPLAVSTASFAQYQTQDAWTWEHMALARARVLYGSAQARAEVENTIKQVLSRPRDAAELKAEVLKMRDQMAEHKPPRGPMDAKLLRGGLVDCEFIIHFLQLRSGTALNPALELAIADLVKGGLLPSDYGDHHAALTRLLVSARLLAPDSQIPSTAAAEALARACQQADLPALLGSLTAARHGIARVWADLFGEKLEIE